MTTVTITTIKGNISKPEIKLPPFPPLENSYSVAAGRTRAEDPSMKCADGRVRFTKQYGAASTLRWGGRGIQPDNTPRDSYDPAIVDKISELFFAGEEADDIVERFQQRRQFC